MEGIFCQELKTVLKETIELWEGYHEGTKVFADLGRGKEQVISRVIELLSLPIGHRDIQRIRKRIIKFNQELFTFLDNPLVEPTNNRAERQLRPNVIMRKITFGNRSALGASNHAVMMSIIQTGILNGIEPLNILLALSVNPVRCLLSNGVKPLTSLTELPKIRSP